LDPGSTLKGSQAGLYHPRDVVRLRGSVMIEHTLARRGSERLWRQLNEDGYIRTFGALTRAQAVNMVKASLQALYLSGRQVAGDANLASQTFPDQSLYPSNSVPAVFKRLNNALMRADQIRTLEGHRLARPHPSTRKLASEEPYTPSS
jgi:isocitrate lyase